MGTRANWAILGIATAFSAAADTLPQPSFEDTLRLLRTNLSLSASEFDHEASQALIERFGGEILPTGASTETLSDAPVVAKKATYDGGCLYLRIGQVTPALAPQLAAALQDTNWVKAARGLILDLRFATGGDFRAAGQAAALFSSGGRKLLEWGDESFIAPPTDKPWQLPTTVLVNAETKGAAEAFAGVLRAENAALVIGSATAGRAAVYRNVDLGNGSFARLPVARVRVDESQTIPASGITPDIAVKARTEQERQYLSDPFTGVTGINGPTNNAVAGTNTIVASVTVRRKLNEAELVRARREGRPIPDFSETTPVLDDNHTIRDPVLARAVDLLKNLAVLNRK